MMKLTPNQRATLRRLQAKTPHAELALDVAHVHTLACTYVNCPDMAKEDGGEGGKAGAGGTGATANYNHEDHRLLVASASEEERAKNKPSYDKGYELGRSAGRIKPGQDSRTILVDDAKDAPWIVNGVENGLFDAGYTFDRKTATKPGESHETYVRESGRHKGNIIGLHVYPDFKDKTKMRITIDGVPA